MASAPTAEVAPFDVFVATGEAARSAEAVGTKVVAGGEVSFGTQAT